VRPRQTKLQFLQRGMPDVKLARPRGSWVDHGFRRGRL